MGYLVQKTRPAQLSIDGQDYTSSLISWEVSDSSAFKNGLMTTTGTLVLGQRPGGADIQDYDRNAFKRGTLVTLDVAEPGGSSYRHPRGHLYVVSVSYEVETEQLVIDLGCRLALAYLTDQPDDILPLIPIPLDSAQQTIQNCAASFASAGKVLYQDNTGSLVSTKFFEGDSSAGVASGQWVSVLGETTLAASPLAGSTAIPDRIELSYQIPEGLLADDNTGKVDTVVETSNYFLNFPATVWKRNPPPTTIGGGIPSGGITVPPAGPVGTTGCGNTPVPPSTGPNNYYPPNSGSGQAPISCSEGWTTNREAVYLPAVRVSTSTTTYGAPGGQTSFAVTKVEGPAVEASAQYYADKYAYCSRVYGYGCSPNGNCPYEGLETIELSRTETTYQYDPESNALVRQIVDSYATTLSAANPEDWRSGIKNGVPQSFNGDLDTSGMYRFQRVVTTYEKTDNSNTQITTTYNSITSRGVGIGSGASLDAVNGIVTTVKRESTTTTTLDVRPDTVNTPTTSTREAVSLINLNTDSYKSPPTEAGDYIREEAIPVPLLSDDESQINDWLEDYTEYLVRFVKGDLYGLQLGEALRPEIASSWHPGCPFRYADTANNTIAAMRMDACAWGVTQDESIVVMNGIWNGWSSGTLVIGDNLTGNSRPDLSEGNSPQPPTSPTPPPSIDDDIVGQSFAFTAFVNLWLDVSAFTYFDDGVSNPNPTDFTAELEMTIVPYVSGFVVASGDLLETTGTGSIPMEYGGSIVSVGATVVTADLFA